ncbi:BQ2448_225 [Microbotryum intermedium]|uniref:BQ2448_225 protein n=1 Tax=Microbotryum intermedium TaxID=269621 RepID=A0A238F8A9_9BASI|nr:BQ2448_225 [Microbotryum intermedium]
MTVTGEDDDDHDHDHDHQEQQQQRKQGYEQFKVLDQTSQVDRHVQELKTLSKQLLDSANRATRRESIDKIASTLDQYQLEPFLLDAHLAALLEPYLDQLCSVVLSSERSPSLHLASIEPTCHVLYLFTKLRGPKAIVPLFPPTPQALSSLINLLEPLSQALVPNPVPNAPTSNKPEREPVQLAWATCYILLLWLSVSTRLPFPLPAPTSETIKLIAFSYLQAGKGKEKEGGKLVLRAWYTRKDAPIEELVALTTETLEDPRTELLLASSILSSLLEILKQPTMTQTEVLLSPHNRARLYALVESCRAFGNNRDELRKERIKLIGRLLVLELSSSGQPSERGTGQENIERIVQDLMQTLENRVSGGSDLGPLARWEPDTFIRGVEQESNLRYSAAKHLARVCGLLPVRISSDILDSVLDQFEQSLRSDQDPEQVEARLQGSLLTFAEMGRRGVFGILSGAKSEVAEEVRLMIQIILRGVIQCLTFDHLTSKRSFGTQVRDSASYVVWSLARSLDPRLIDIELGQELGKVLVCVALFDKEVGVRRASSAAFQEGVGRWSIFVDGIDILRKIDFFTISVRRRAFTEAAPLVANFALLTRNTAYRYALIDHLMTHSFPHYEFGLQSLASQALKLIVSIDPRKLVPPLLRAQIDKLGKTKDPTKLHGVFMSLTGLALAARTSPEDSLVEALDQIYASLVCLPSTLRAFRTPQVLIALYKALTSSLDPRIESIRSSPNTQWQSLLALASESSSDSVHLASAQFYEAFTRSSIGEVEDQEHVENIVAALDDRKQTKQAWGAKVLGRWAFSKANAVREKECEIAENIVKRLIDFVASEGKLKAGSIEAKRNGVEALATIVCSNVPIDKLLVREAYTSILVAFQDYTVDHRGDVGSWVRLSAIHATSLCLSSRSTSTTMDQKMFDQLVASLLKQAVGRLDNVRQAAGEVLLDIAEGANGGRMKAREAFGSIGSDRQHWRDLSWSSERLLPLLSVPEYRALLLEGSMMAFTRHSSSTPLIDFAATLPSLQDDHLTTEYTLEALIEGLVALGRQHLASNRIFVPVVDALASIVETGLISDANERISSLLKSALNLTSRSLPKIKTAARLTAASKFVVALLPYVAFRALVADQLGVLLSHPLAPWVRQMAADEVMDQISSGTLNLQSEENGERLQEILVQTLWSQGETKWEQVALVKDLLKVVGKPETRERST